MLPWGDAGGGFLLLRPLTVGYVALRRVIIKEGEPKMKFFIDTADVNEIREAQNMGLLNGVTTNPSLIAKLVEASKKSSQNL